MKEENNYNSKEVKISSIEQLARQLGIPNELMQHHRFMVGLKCFICTVCCNSNRSSLRDLTSRKRIDLKGYWDVHFSENELEMLLEEIGHLQWLTDEQIAEWLERTNVNHNEIKYYSAMVLGEEGKSVYFQEISKSGAEVFRAPKIASSRRYGTDENGNLILDASYQYDTYSTDTREIIDSNNKTLKRISYDKDGKIIGTMSQEEEDKHMEK